MSSYFLVQLSCDFNLDIPSKLVEMLKRMGETEDHPLRDFPGWSIHKFELVEKWENHKCYTFSWRFSMHEDVFADWLGEFLLPFLKKLAKYGLSEGFVGTIENTDTNHPDLIYFLHRKPVIWSLETEGYLTAENIPYIKNSGWL